MENAIIALALFAVLAAVLAGIAFIADWIEAREADQPYIDTAEMSPLARAAIDVARTEDNAHRAFNALPDAYFTPEAINARVYDFLRRGSRAYRPRNRMPRNTRG